MWTPFVFRWVPGSAESAVGESCFQLFNNLAQFLASQLSVAGGLVLDFGHYQGLEYYIIYYTYTHGTNHTWSTSSRIELH